MVSCQSDPLGSRTGSYNSSGGAQIMDESKPTFKVDDLVKRGYERGRITGIINEDQVRVYWYNGSNMYHETVLVGELEPDNREPLKAL